LGAVPYGEGDVAALVGDGLPVVSDAALPREDDVEDSVAVVVFAPEVDSEPVKYPKQISIGPKCNSPC
jgi:hypothetical protein